jgi:hypothetical protein
MPHCFSNDEAMAFIPHLVEKPSRILRILDPDRIRAKLSPDEHIYRFADFSAFNEETIQDVKYHKVAEELYYVLDGAVSIRWKHISDANWNPKILLTDESGKWIHIPALHCLLLEKGTNRFLAVAFKTQESTKANGNKIQGNYCSIKLCEVRGECERLQKEREEFFKSLKQKNAKQ